MIGDVEDSLWMAHVIWDFGMRYGARMPGERHGPFRFRLMTDVEATSFGLGDNYAVELVCLNGGIARRRSPRVHSKALLS